MIYCESNINRHPSARSYLAILSCSFKTSTTTWSHHHSPVLLSSSSTRSHHAAVDDTISSRPPHPCPLVVDDTVSVSSPLPRPLVVDNTVSSRCRLVVDDTVSGLITSSTTQSQVSSPLPCNPNSLLSRRRRHSPCSEITGRGESSCSLHQATNSRAHSLLCWFPRSATSPRHSIHLTTARSASNPPSVDSVHRRAPTNMMASSHTTPTPGRPFDQEGPSFVTS
jgi:hypothetical protein